jgi:hypothetical protein
MTVSVVGRVELKTRKTASGCGDHFALPCLANKLAALYLQKTKLKNRG